MNNIVTEEIVIEKIIYGGQALGQLLSGKKVFVWGGLPGETVRIKIIKNKKNFAEAVVEEVATPSKYRVKPKDAESYLSTSPWQILDYNYENDLKKQLISDQFSQHGIELKLNNYSAPDEPYFYRNKVEFSFWWNNDTNQLDLAFFKRGTHTKQPVEETSLSHPDINNAAVAIRDFLRQKNIQARDLKTLLIRRSHNEDVIAELYLKNEDIKINVSHKDLNISGFSVFYSNPKSPASIKTKVLSISGKTQLEDTILDKKYAYSVDGFFQVNLPMYEAALKIMQKFVDYKKPLLDMYSGVGSIGLSLATANQPLILIEVDERCVIEATNNAKNIKPDTEVILASSEVEIEQIKTDMTVILDPPRAGLHQKVIERLLEVKPQKILYLSCNPSTQARDVALLKEVYHIEYAHGFNFFPRTPHIENLVVLENQNI